jgi:hypothetical protein
VGPDHHPFANEAEANVRHLPPFLDEADDTLQLESARETFAGKFDIIEVFGGYLAVPDGVQVVQASTVDGLVGKLRRRAEE